MSHLYIFFFPILSPNSYNISRMYDLLFYVGKTFFFLSGFTFFSFHFTVMCNCTPRIRHSRFIPKILLQLNLMEIMKSWALSKGYKELYSVEQVGGRDIFCRWESYESPRTRLTASMKHHNHSHLCVHIFGILIRTYEEPHA